jgi:hypothetical protein
MPKNYGGKLDREGLMDSFDPNEPDLNEWASFIPRWRGAFQTHKDRAAALRALCPRFTASGILYNRRNGGRWEEIARFDVRDDQPERCERCGHNPTFGAVGAVLFDEGLDRVWIKHRRRVIDPPQLEWLCSDCRQKN